MAMIDGEPNASNNNYEQTQPQANDVENQQNQMTNDLQQLSFESSEMEIPSPSKVNFS